MALDLTSHLRSMPDNNLPHILVCPGTARRICLLFFRKCSPNQSPHRALIISDNIFVFRTFRTIAARNNLHANAGDAPLRGRCPAAECNKGFRWALLFPAGIRSTCRNNSYVVCHHSSAMYNTVCGLLVGPASKIRDLGYLFLKTV